MLAHLGGLAPDEARKAIEGLLDLVGEAPLGARTHEEIVERLIEQAADAAAVRLDSKVAATITGMLAVSGPAPDALAQIRTLTKSAGMALEAPLAAMEARLAALEPLGIDPKRVAFAARFGRNMEYYTGFVFELWARDAEARFRSPVADAMTVCSKRSAPGARFPPSACAIRTERVLAARKAQV